MTEPTDAELLEEYDRVFNATRTIDRHGVALRAVLAKFGTPTAEHVDWIGASSHHLLQPTQAQATQAQAGAVPLPKSYQASVLTSNSHGSGCRVSFSFGSVAEAEAWHESLIDQHHGITDGPNGKSA